MEKGVITIEFAQELMDCIWVKLNDLNKVRDEASAEGFAGYSLFQNLIAGGQDKCGVDAANDLSFMCLEASMHVGLPQPSMSVRIWNGTPHEFMLKAAELTRMGMGLPAYYNDKDKFNKNLPKNFRGAEDATEKPGLAFGLLVVQGLVAAIEGLDTMLKSADVRLIHTEKRLGGRLVTLIVIGEVSAVLAAVAAGEKKAETLGKVYGRAVIASSHAEVAKFFDYKA